MAIFIYNLTLKPIPEVGGYREDRNGCIDRDYHFGFRALFLGGCHGNLHGQRAGEWESHK